MTKDKIFGSKYQALTKLESTRIYFPKLGWDAVQNVEIHGFYHASMLVFGAVIYLCIYAQGSYHTSFVAAKGRVTSIKKITLNRLELKVCCILR